MYLINSRDLSNRNKKVKAKERANKEERRYRVTKGNYLLL
jgi:hypothetical protein